LASVLIPWAGCDPHRLNALRWVTARYEALGWQVQLGTCPDGPWCKALAVADALRHAEGDRLVVADADAWCPDITEAVAALDTTHWAVPHRLVYRLSLAATEDLLAGGDPRMPPPASDLDNPPYHGTVGGGVVAIRRDTYESVPLDPRFRGWGGEDASWGVALHKLAGRPWVGTGPLLHFWHPPQDASPEVRGPRAKVTIPDPANRQLNHRYRDAKVSTKRMQALVQEAREATWQSASS
jgi:hypothetical protein